MLDTFQQWLQANHPALETKGITFEFYGDTIEQTVKTNNLNFTYARYECRICLWETGDCNMTLADRGTGASESSEECFSFVELHFGNPPELDSVLSPFFETLGELPYKNISVRTALLHFWQRLPIQVRQ